MVDGKKLKKQIIQIFKKHGLNEKHANIASSAIINAEIVGAHTHGLSRLKMYCDRIKKKVINPKPKIKIKKISTSITSIDADNAVGFIGAEVGINCAIKNAKKSGIEMGDYITEFKIENSNRPNKKLVYPIALFLLLVFGYLNKRRTS